MAACTGFVRTSLEELHVGLQLLTRRPDGYDRWAIVPLGTSLSKTNRLSSVARTLRRATSLLLYVLDLDLRLIQSLLFNQCEASKGHCNCNCNLAPALTASLQLEQDPNESTVMFMGLYRPARALSSGHIANRTPLGPQGRQTASMGLYIYPSGPI